MVNLCEQIVQEYTQWLQKNITVATIGDVCEITTPFLDRHNDYLQIYLYLENDDYILSDDGYILSDLEMSGVEIDTTSHRKQILKTILAGFGVVRVGNELQVKAQSHNLAQKKHNLLQAMLAVNDMFVLARHRVSSLFQDTVESFLLGHEIRFSSNETLIGLAGYPHKFDFMIPASNKAPERFIQAINNPSRQKTSDFLFAWKDTSEVRSPKSEAYVMLNNDKKQVPDKTLEPFKAYDITPIIWSEREKYLPKLAA